MVIFLLEVGAVSSIADADIGASLPIHWDIRHIRDTKKSILDLLREFVPDFVDDNFSRDYHEYEAEWADDPTYVNKG